MGVTKMIVDALVRVWVTHGVDSIMMLCVVYARS